MNRQDWTKCGVFCALLSGCGAPPDEAPPEDDNPVLPVPEDTPDDEIVPTAGVTCRGNYNDVLTRFGGTDFRSNGTCTGTASGDNQCPEVIKRYCNHRDEPTWRGNGDTWCSSARARQRNLIMLANGEVTPRVGDICGFTGSGGRCGGGYGHVGLVCGLTERGWSLCDQNRSSSQDPAALTRSGLTLSSFSASCPTVCLNRPGVKFDSAGLGSGSYRWTLSDARVVSTGSAYLRLDPGLNDPQLISPSGLGWITDPSRGGVGTMLMRYRRFGRASNRMRFYWKHVGNREYLGGVEAILAGDRAGWTQVSVPLGGRSDWRSGPIDRVRIDFVQYGDVRGDDSFDIDFVRFD